MTYQTTHALFPCATPVTSEGLYFFQTKTPEEATAWQKAFQTLVTVSETPALPLFLDEFALKARELERIVLHHSLHTRVLFL